MKAQLASATSLLALLALQGGPGVATYGSLASSVVTGATALTAVTAVMAASSPAEAGPVTFTSASTTLVTVAGGGTLTIYDLLNGGAATRTVTASGKNDSGSSRGITARAYATTSVTGITLAGKNANGTAVSSGSTATLTRTYTVAATQRTSVSAIHNYTFGSGNTASTLTIVGSGVAPTQNMTVSNNSITAAGANLSSGSVGNILVGNSAAVTLLVSNSGNGNLSGTTTDVSGIISNLRGSFGTPSPSSSVFTGTAASITVGDNKTQSAVYTFAPTSRGAVTTSATTIFNNGNTTNGGSTVVTTLVGKGVAPVLNISTTASAGYALVGQTKIAAFTTTNTGDGNTSGLGTISNLRGSVGSAASGGFTGGAASVSLTDSGAQTTNYVFTPTARGAATATITAAFSNGNATNGANTSTATLLGTGVAPVLNVTSTASASFVLVGQTGTMTVTVTNSGDGNLSGLGTISNLRGTMATAGSSGFSGGGNSVSLGDTSSANYTYVYTPTARGAATVNLASSFVNGSATNGAGTASTALVGTGVAPVNAVSSGNALVRIGTTGNATVSISNVGDGNKSGAGTISNLNGTYTRTLGTGFSAASPSAISLADSASTTIGFTYSATSRTTATSTASISFSNGKSDGTNGSQVVSQTVSATGVGPTYASSFAGSNVTPVANNLTGSSLNLGSLGVGYWQSYYLTLANVTTDANGGNDALTDLTIESFAFSGPNAANFQISSGTGIIHKGSSILVPIQVFSATNAALVSTLTILTDQSAALGGIGDTFTYQLTAVAAPEPATMAVIGAGLAGLAFARRKRREKVDA